MNRNFLLSLAAVSVLAAIPWLGALAGLTGLFGIVIPYLAFFIFLAGIIWKVMSWSKSAVPFKIPTTAGQQKSLPWIKANPIDNPFSKKAVVVRMLLEVLFFRSLFRNTVMAVRDSKTGPKLSYAFEIFLWAGALAFHYTFLIVSVRHLRLFLEPVPVCVQFLEDLDGMFKMEYISDVVAIGLPAVMLSGLVLLGAVSFLLLRRLSNSQVRYISLLSDYFPLLLIAGIAVSGILMRYFIKVDMTSVKDLTLGFASFQPVIPEGIGSIFYIHLFLVSILFIYFPFSKLMHMGGVFLSPTRNMTADTRARRHINPWNPKVHTHTYEEYEDEFREKMIGVGLPVDKKE